MVFTKKLFSPLGYNIYWEGVLTCFAMIGMAMLLLYYFNVILNANFSKIVNILMVCSSASGIVLALQYFFFMQIFEIYFAIDLTIAAAICTYKWILENKKLYCPLGIILMIWAFSSYQAMVPLYILVGLVGYLFYKEDKLNKHIGLIVKLLLSFIIAFVINTVITKLFFSSSDYLDVLYAWKNGQAVHNIIEHIKSVLMLNDKNAVIYTWHYGILLMAYMLWLIYNIILILLKKKKMTVVWCLKILAIIVMFISPFYLTIYTGTIPALRAQISLHFFIIFAYVFWVSSIKKIKGLKTLCIFLMIVNVGHQGYVTSKLFYTDDVRYQSDVQYAYQMVEYLKRHGIQENELPVVFVGELPAGTNNSCYAADEDLYEYYGESIWGIHSVVQPYYYWSSENEKLMMDMIGAHFGHASEDQVLEGRKEAVDMPCWPQEGSLKVVNDEFVVVKLSDDVYENKN